MFNAMAWHWSQRHLLITVSPCKEVQHLKVGVRFRCIIFMLPFPISPMLYGFTCKIYVQVLALINRPV